MQQKIVLIMFLKQDSSRRGAKETRRADRGDPESPRPPATLSAKQRRSGRSRAPERVSSLGISARSSGLASSGAGRAAGCRGRGCRANGNRVHGRGRSRDAGPPMMDAASRGRQVATALDDRTAPIEGASLGDGRGGRRPRLTAGKRPGGAAGKSRPRLAVGGQHGEAPGKVCPRWRGPASAVVARETVEQRHWQRLALTSLAPAAAATSSRFPQLHSSAAMARRLEHGGGVGNQRAAGAPGDMESVEVPVPETPSTHDSDDDNLSTDSEGEYKVPHDTCDRAHSVQRVLDNLTAWEMIAMAHMTTTSTTTSMSRARTR